MEQSVKYFQFGREYKYPYFIKLKGEKLCDSAQSYLTEFGFKELSEQEYKSTLIKNSNFKTITMMEASSRLRAQIGMGQRELSIFGAESVTPANGYEVYRFKGHGLLVFSQNHKVWEMGLSLNFSQENHVLAFKQILARVSGLAMGQLGVPSFWAVPVDEGVVVMKSHQSEAEVVFFDFDRNKVITLEGEKEVDSQFQVIRLDETLRGMSKDLNSEQLFAYLSTNLNYFSYKGATTELKNKVVAICRHVKGTLLPVENFKPRTDLSYL